MSEDNPHAVVHDLLIDLRPAKGVFLRSLADRVAVPPEEAGVLLVTFQDDGSVAHFYTGKKED